MRFAIVGSDTLGSEELRAVEFGIRGQTDSRISYDLTLFDMDYQDLRAYAPSDVVCSTGFVSIQIDPTCFLSSDSVITELELNNDGSGAVRGMELIFDFDVRDNVRFRATYAYAKETLHVEPTSQLETRASVPENQLTLRTEWAPSNRINLAMTLRYVDELAMWSLEDYWQGSLQLNWRVNNSWRLSAGARNLFSRDNIEFVSELLDVVPIRVGHSYFLAAELGF